MKRKTSAGCREIEYRYDSMNEDLAFQRVRIRKVLLPLLEDFNPKIIENLTQTAFLLQKDFNDLENVRAEQRQILENEINSEISLEDFEKN